MLSENCSGGPRRAVCKDLEPASRSGTLAAARVDRYRPLDVVEASGILFKYCLLLPLEIRVRWHRWDRVHSFLQLIR